MAFKDIRESADNKSAKHLGQKAKKSKISEADLKKRYERDHVMVKGRFRFIEVPGGILEFSFSRYKDDPIYRYSLKDGEILELPYMIAKHLATGVYNEVYQHQVDEHGKPITVSVSKIHRTAFERIDFDDDDFIPSPLVTVETNLSI